MSRAAAPASTIEFTRHDGATIRIEETMTAGVMRQRNLTQTPLDRYRQRKTLTARQCDAGERLHGDFRATGRQAAITFTLDDGPRGSFGGGSAEASVRYGDAIRKMGRLAHVVFNVACLGEYAADWAKLTGRDPKGAMELLRAGLDTLADHYGMAQDPA